MELSIGRILGGVVGESIDDAFRWNIVENVRVTDALEEKIHQSCLVCLG